MASLPRRAATRALFAGGAAVVAILVARDCEQEHHHEVIIDVDPRPMGEGVRAIRIDLFDARGERGSMERRYRPGEERSPVRLRASAPGAGGELNIEVETDDGLRRARRPLEVAPGSTVKVRLGEGDVIR